MKANRSLLLFLLVMSFISWFSRAAAPTEPGPLVEGNSTFACDLYARLKTTPGNLFLSPYSISSCLAMACAGARGNTEKEIANVLHLPGNPAQVRASFATLQEQLKQAGKQKGIELSIANALWAQQGHPFLPAFLQVAQQEYEASLKQADFKTAAAEVTREINGWVAEQTKGKIQNIIAPGALDQMTRLVLANAIYFKGAWANPFEKSNTRPQPFHISSTRQIDAPLMTHAETVNYLENNEFQAAELPYAGGQFAMVILLPRQIDGCPSFERSLTSRNLKSWLGQMRQQKVELYIPRFKLESGFALQSVLANMGMAEAFSVKADFSGMDGARDLFISSVSHKAWVEVNEEGTEAAAATVVGVAAMAYHKPPPPPPVFRADHPFIFLIRDTSSGSVLFLGRLANPMS
jgi:serpin B